MLRAWAMAKLSVNVNKIATLREVSIDHALICESLYEGLETIVKKYLRPI